MDDLGFWRIATDHPDRLAVVDPSGTERTFGELHAATNRLVHGLRALGFQKGDAVACVLKNGREMLEVYLAVTQAGGYVVPVNTHLEAPEIAYILQDSGAVAVVCSASLADRCRAAADEAGLAPERRFSAGAAEGFRPLAALSEGQPDTPPADRSAGAPMTYTSGTTGRPKGVRRPLGDMPPEAAGARYAAFLFLFGMQPHDGVHLVVSPMYHTAVLNFATSSLHLGHTVVIMDRWTPEGMLDLCDRHGVTHSHMVPTQLVRLLALPEEARARYELSSLRQMIHSAAPCPPDVKRAMLDWWGPVIYEYYAASEGGGTLATPSDWLKKPGTVGCPWPISQIEIRDDEGNACAPGEPGTVWICMGDLRFEYHGDKAKTDKAWRDAFFTVGDIGYLDDDGFLFLCDRKADMIISGGVNIYPAEIESTLILHPAVADVAVFGIPDADWGEQVKAVVEPVEGAAADEALAEEILAWCAGRLAKYKRPKSVDFVAALPRDPNGKLYKRKLRDPYWENAERAI